MSARLNWLLQRGLSPSQAIDYHFVEDLGIPPEDHAVSRDITPRGVTRNVENADAHLHGDQDDAADEGDEQTAMEELFDQGGPA